MMHRLVSSARAAASSSRGLLLRARPSASSIGAPRTTTPRHRPSPLQAIRWHGDGPGPDAPTVDITFVNPDDSHTKVSARVGETLLQTAHRTGVEMEGACEGVCACSTCHVILEDGLYDALMDDMEDGALGEDEEDMLDMAFGLTHTSRLGCQVTITEGMEGGVFTLPKATRNFYVDGHKPTPH